MLFWVILLPLFLLKENRNRRALWILLPYFAWLLIVRLGTGLPYIADVLEPLVPLAATFCGILLLAQRLERRNGWLNLAATIGWAAAMHGLWVLLNRNIPLAALGIMSGSTLSALMLAMLLTRLCCKRSYRAVRIALLPAPFILLIVTLITTIGIVLTMRSHLGDVWDADMIWFVTSIATWIAALAGSLYILLLSFLVVPLASAFYRQRLCILLKLKHSAKQTPDPTAS